MMMIAIAQANAVVGDISANINHIVRLTKEAKKEGADIIVFPELMLSGYPPEDLLLRPAFLAACKRGLINLLDLLEDGITVIIGHPYQIGVECFNTASVIRDGKIIASYHKMLLPNETVFDEVRYFVPGVTPCVFSHINQQGEKIDIGVVICEDLWAIEPVSATKEAGAEIIISLNASPYYLNKIHRREEIIRHRIEESELPIIYCNAIGGQDELIFDGQSFAYNADLELVMRAPAFEENLAYLHFQQGKLLPTHISPLLSEEASMYSALVLGVRDYLHKNGFSGALLGLSGGIDSALTLAIACDALGAENVQAVMLPSPYTADISLIDARTLADNVNVAYEEIPIQPIFDAFLSSLAPFLDQHKDLTEENLQARIRGTLLMALSNKSGKILLNTSNKSEVTTGYGTLYGDMAGGFAVLKDISKTSVYALARYRNSIDPIIPTRIIERAPSAELKPDQTDQDTLPDYAVLDAITSSYMEQNKSIEELIKEGLNEQDVHDVVRRLRMNEYKRRQAPIGPRITHRAYGKDWRYPITNHFTE